MDRLSGVILGWVYLVLSLLTIPLQNQAVSQPILCLLHHTLL